jgi:hypothetical protein
MNPRHRNLFRELDGPLRHGIKPRSDAKLKTLPDERQKEIYDRLRRGGVRQVRAWLSDQGFSISIRALSEFYAWFEMRKRFEQDERSVNRVIEELKRETPNLTQQQLDSLAQRMFTMLTIRDGDIKSWLGIQRAKWRKRKLSGA